MTSLPPLRPGLHVAATPIGNLGDVSDRLRHALGSADVVLCEDTRVTGKLLNILGMASRPLRPYHDHNGTDVRPKIIADLRDGATFVLVSDAGTPLISDPGYKLVREAREAGIDVHAIPGPSAVMAALSIAGAPSDRFSFQGFLPPKAAARQARLETLKDRGETTVFFESGTRLSRFLDDVLACWGDVPVMVARELTKLHEEVVEGTAASLAARYATAPPKGEIVVILPPLEQTAMTEADADALMREALKTLSLKDAVREVASVTGMKKRELYQRWLNRDA